MSQVWPIALGAVVGIAVLAVFLLAVLIGFSLFGDSTKFRSRKNSKTIRSLDEPGGTATYLPPDAPRGPVDQLANSK